MDSPIEHEASRSASRWYVKRTRRIIRGMSSSSRPTHRSLRRSSRACAMTNACAGAAALSPKLFWGREGLCARCCGNEVPQLRLDVRLEADGREEGGGEEKPQEDVPNVAEWSVRLVRMTISGRKSSAPGARLTCSATGARHGTASRSQTLSPCPSPARVSHSGVGLATGEQSQEGSGGGVTGRAAG
eukprot:scaffold11320_cov121-Isochrysis_galbana.AAC.4